MCHVENYKEWEQYARLLDYLEGCVEWKYRPESQHYDYVRIDVRRVMMKQLRISGNVKTLSHCLRQDLVKNIGNISDPQLYNQCHFGTKRNIEKYIDEVIKCVRAIYHADPT
jgi:TAG lipase/lysophosphatidylethanolamine acyltransferase